MRKRKLHLWSSSMLLFSVQECRGEAKPTYLSWILLQGLVFSPSTTFSFRNKSDFEMAGGPCPSYLLFPSSWFGGVALSALPGARGIASTHGDSAGCWCQRELLGGSWRMSPIGAQRLWFHVLGSSQLGSHRCLQSTGSPSFERKPNVSSPCTHQRGKLCVPPQAAPSCLEALRAAFAPGMGGFLPQLMPQQTLLHDIKAPLAYEETSLLLCLHPPGAGNKKESPPSLCYLQKLKGNQM